MITNILAVITVQLVTNVNEINTDFAKMEPVSVPPGFENRQRGVDPSTKYVTTIVKRVTTLSFDWMGRREVSEEEVISRNTVKLVRQWVKQPEDDAALRSFKGWLYKIEPTNAPAITNKP